jgi:Tfp pilus assembly protein PilE
MRIRSVIAVVPLVLFASASLRAQAVAGDAEQAIRTRLKSDLRNLVVAQEKYFAEHSTYADQIDALAYRASQGAQVSLVATQNNAWAAVATDASAPGKSCTIFINLAEKYRPKTAQEKRPGVVEGAPLCDGDPKPEP